MPAIGNLVLKDAATTPADHTFAPVNADKGVARWANRASFTLKGQEQLTFEVRSPSTPGGAHRVILGMGDPTEVAGAAAGTYVTDHINSGQIVLNFAQSSTEQERKDLLAMFASALGNAAVKTAVANVEPFY